jgi:thiamine-monophosphate kinase
MKHEKTIIETLERAMPVWAAGRLPLAARALRLGIGDDAAIVAPSKGREWAVSCDAFLEGVHFLERVTPADAVGWKALVRATSDLAAMGATPRLFFLTLALPPAKTGRWLAEFAAGMGRAARSLGMRLAGGDTTANERVAISVTVLGEVRRGRAVTRSGARPGDLIYVSGRLGGAELGLRILQERARRLGAGHGVRSGLRAGGLRRDPLMRAHFYPTIRVELGRWLADRRAASAMIDISDGLSTDLARLAAASGAGARIWSERVPRVTVPEGLREAGRRRFDALELALHGGDDYELLFTVPRSKAGLLQRAPGGAKLSAIGEITREKRMVLVGTAGKKEILRAGGWDSFQRA